MRIKVDGKDFEVKPDENLLVNLNNLGFNIPSLCYMPGLKPEARCRMCVVEVNNKLITSCSHYPKEGMEVFTDSERVRRARKINAELLLAEHKDSCSQEHELCKIIDELALRETRFEPLKDYKLDLGEAIIRNNNLCINCGRCVQVCTNIQSVNAISFAFRGHEEHVTPVFEKDLSEVACTFCGQCLISCPVGAIKEREHLNEVLKALKDKKKHVVIQTAPSIRASLGEEFGLPPGTLVKGKMVAALRRCGFDKVFDTDLGADLTIMEEATELLERIKNNGPFPMFTSCCPAWVKFVEHFYHQLIPNLSTCKSPHEMLGTLIKKYYAKLNGLKDVIVVSAMPCTAKKFEAARKELKKMVDFVLTTREIARLIKYLKIDFVNLPDEDFDPALGISTGAGAIFGATGGVMEAALRTAYEIATGKKLTKIEFDQLRGLNGIKEGSIIINGKEIRFAAVSGLANTRELLKRMNKYHFIEVMACPGGCIAGGGQPLPKTKERIEKRMRALYEEDAKLPLRKSHENPIIKKLYDEFLEKPLSRKSEELLHTRYKKRED